MLRRAEASSTGCQMDVMLLTELMADDLVRLSALVYDSLRHCAHAVELVLAQPVLTGLHAA